MVNAYGRCYKMQYRFLDETECNVDVLIDKSCVRLQVQKGFPEVVFYCVARK